jgi:hypothetical protein
MRYLCLIYDGDPEKSLPKNQYEDLVEEHLAYDESLRKSGHFITAEALDQGETPTVVRMRDGKISATDGPFSETKEQIGGFVLINARDLNEAIRVAAHFPVARIGRIEIRPVRDLTGWKRSAP